MHVENHHLTENCRDLRIHGPGNIRDIQRQEVISGSREEKSDGLRSVTKRLCSHCEKLGAGAHLTGVQRRMCGVSAIFMQKTQ